MARNPDVTPSGIEIQLFGGAPTARLFTPRGKPDRRTNHAHIRYANHHRAGDGQHWARLLAYSAHGEADVTELLRDADRSMLAIKKSRRRGGPSKESSINISSHRSAEMNDIVVRAIDENLLELAFQPIVSLVAGQIWAFKALVRYTHPALGPLSPSSLIEKAKGLGRLDALTCQFAVKAMAAAAEFRLVEPQVLRMTINVEAGQIVPDRVGT